MSKKKEKPPVIKVIGYCLAEGAIGAFLASLLFPNPIALVLGGLFGLGTGIITAYEGT